MINTFGFDTDYAISVTHFRVDANAKKKMAEEAAAAEAANLKARNDAISDVMDMINNAIRYLCEDDSIHAYLDIDGIRKHIARCLMKHNVPDDIIFEASTNCAEAYEDSYKTFESKICHGISCEIIGHEFTM